jgi:hypothetical protein
MHGEENMGCKLSLLAGLAVASMAAAIGIVAAQPAAAPGVCGEYMYWHDGECSDARDKKSGKTWTEEILAKHWKP